MTSLKNDDSNFVSNTLASQEEDIWHYWNARHNSMTNEEIENALEALTTGTTRFHTKGKHPMKMGLKPTVFQAS